MDDLEMLKLILRENDSPFFSDEQLRFYAEKNNLYNDNYGAGNESVYRLWDKRIWKQYQYSKKG